jgi:cytoskeletal protein CcmA (bactofilin family)
VPAPAVEDLLTSPSEAALASSRARTYFDPKSEVRGKLNFVVPVQIDGRVDGEIDAQDGLTIGTGAVVTASIKGVSIIVAGTVGGDISASHRASRLRQGLRESDGAQTGRARGCVRG